MSNKNAIGEVNLDLNDQINQVLELHSTNQRHSLFQLKYFVLGKEATHQGKLRRCLQELEARRSAIDGYNKTIEDLKDDKLLSEIEYKRIKSLPSVDEYSNMEISVLLNKKRRKIEAITASINDLDRKKTDTLIEAKFFLNSFLTLESREKLKSFDDFQTNSEIWNTKLTDEMNLRLMFNKSFDIELIKTILATDDNLPIKKELLKVIDNIKNSSPKVECQIKNEVELLDGE